jgi:adenosylmethionine-8-amino-7-oxononanoate aminotransferase
MKSVTDTGELVIARGNGSYVFDEDDRRYLDLSASLWYCLIGHGRREMAEAAADQMLRLEAYSTFSDLSNPPARELAERVAALAPMRDAAVFFTSGGSDSIDTAIKIVRRYWQAMDQTDRTVLIARRGAYHGMHLGGTSLAGIPAMRQDGRDPLSDVRHVQWDSLAAIEETIADAGTGRVAAIFVEPVLGVGGVLAPPDGYLLGVQDICRRTGALLVVDEVITGFGRLGTWFGCSRVGIEPDLIVCAKGLTSGYLPLGAVVAGPRVSAPFYDGTVGPWRHGYTYSGHATACAVALANLDVIEREDLLSRSRHLERELAQRLTPLASHDLIAEVRAGFGALASLRLSPQALERSPTLPAQFSRTLREHGALTRALVGGEIQISPPLIWTNAELDWMEQAIDRTVRALGT